MSVDNGYRRARNVRNVKLFGFNLTMTSALLLFIMGVALIAGGLFGVYQVLSILTATGYFGTVYFLIYMLLIVLGTYIAVQCVRFRRYNV